MADTETEPICRVEEPTVDLLVHSDVHLKTSGAHYPDADLSVEGHDLVVSLDDVINENRRTVDYHLRQLAEEGQVRRKKHSKRRVSWWIPPK